MIDEQNFFDQPVRNILIRYDSTRNKPVCWTTIISKTFK